MNVRTAKFIHRWLAFILGIFVIFQVTSGSIAAESRLLMQWFYPEKYQVAISGRPATPSQIQSTMRSLAPDFNIAHVMVPPPNRADTAYILMGGRNPEDLHESKIMVDYDQYQQQIIGEHPLIESGWIGTMTVLHRWIVFGEAGFYVVCVLGAATVMMSLSGLFLYLRTRKTAQQLPFINRCHRSLGALASLFLIVTSVSGIAMSAVYWGDRKENLSVFANMMNMESESAHVGHDAALIDPDAAYSSAQSMLSTDYHLAAYSYAGHHSPNYWFAFFNPQMFRQDVVVDGFSGEVKGVYAAGKTERGEGFRNLLLPIHSGKYFGPLGGFLMTFFGFIVVLWLLSGIIMYIRSKRASSW
jgi:uncharacterized iron-regulated membrane protein